MDNEKWREIRRTISSSSHQQAEQFEKAGSEVAELTRSVEELAPIVTASSEAASEAVRAMDRGDAAMSELQGTALSLGRIRERLEEVNQMVKAVDHHTQAIGRIAADSRMLAVNAAIEAARAGDAGKGFGVVSTSVRELAKNSADAAVTIGGIVSTSLESIGSAVHEIIEIIERNEALTQRVQTELAASHVKVEQISRLLVALSDVRTRQSESSKSIRDRFASAAETNSRLASDLIGQLTGSRVEEASPTDVHPKLAQFSAVFDVRRVDEFCDALGHIAGATNLPIGPELEAALDSYDRQGNYLFVCRSGGRSARAVRLAQELGFVRLTNLKGGMLAWNQEQLPLEKATRAA